MMHVEGYYDACGDTKSTSGDTAGDIMSISGDVQYIREIS